ncbi:MAG: c-type cytochrome biogenesis protein CcmI [Alphaproteobacteria bacterium]|nr:c-type cytochrome biogenesis protein CcmI [Alphaproteobacteria bacterium]
MTLLSIFAAMTAGVLALLLIPLLRSRGPVAAARDTYDLAVYRDQLAEVDRDVERGLLAPAAAEMARVEIQRRMLAVGGDGSGGSVDKGRDFGPAARAAMIAVVAVAVPLVAFNLYLTLGRPDLPDQPFAGREVEAEQMVALVEQLAKRMEATPDNVKGWVLLGRSNSMLGRFRQAADAYRKAIEHGGTDAETWTMYGEALIQADDGAVSAAARAAFLAAYRADPESPGPRFYLGLAESQGGDPKRAIAIWRHLERSAPPDAPWLPEIKERIAAVAAGIGPGAADIAPAPPDPNGGPAPSGADHASFPAGQNDLIVSMVERLAARLAAAPDDFDGWMRLGRSYLVLGDAAKAADAYTRASALRPDDAEAKAGLAEAQAQKP